MIDSNECKIKISQLQAFVTVADCQNFSSAALQLGLSQSTISHAIATLEEELGVVLFFRGRHGAMLTSEGEQVIQEARQILHLLETIQKKAVSARGLQSGQVRLASVRSITTHILPRVIAQFRSKFPTVTVLMSEYDRYAEVEDALRDGKADIGFTSLPVTAELDSWELFHDEFVALLPPDHPASTEPLTWEQLVSYPMIMNLRSQRHNQNVYDHLAKFGQTLKIDYEVREDSTVIGMVKQGLGATIMARLVAEPIPDEIQVKPLPVPLERIIGVAVLADGLLSRAVFAFLDTIRETFQR